jgi:hypothetical protein
LPQQNRGAKGRKRAANSAVDSGRITFGAQKLAREHRRSLRNQLFECILANHPTAEIWPPKSGLAADRQWNSAEGFADAEIRTEYRFLIKYHGLAIKVSPATRGSRLSRFLPPGKNPVRIFLRLPWGQKPRAIKDLRTTLGKIEGAAGNPQILGSSLSN